MTKVFKMKAKQERFCQEYIIDLNGAQAAIRAGYSKKAAKSIGSRLLTFANVKSRIEELQATLTKEGIASAEQVGRELTLLAMVDMATFITVRSDGLVKVNDFDTLPEGATRCIRKIKQKIVRKVDTLDREGAPLEEITTEIELWSKTDSLEMLGRQRNLFKGKEEDEDKLMGININITDARKT